MKKIVQRLGILLMASPFWVYTQDYTVSITPTSLYAGQTNLITYTTPPGASLSGDWIGKYRTGFPLEAVNIWSVSGTSGKTNQKAFFFNTPGDWTLQYFDSSGFARSAPADFTVQIGTEAYNLLVTNQTSVGLQFSILWQSAMNLNILNDVIAISPSTNSSLFISSFLAETHSGTAYRTIGRPGVYFLGYYKKDGANYVLVSPLRQINIGPAPMDPTTKLSGNNLMVKWYGYSGATYRVTASTNLAVPLASWSLIKSWPGANGYLSYTNQTTGPQKFFGIQEIWPP